MMQLIDEAKDLKWDTFMGIPTVHCQVLEDNSGCLEMARLPKMRPRTKHINIRMHHFREHVRKRIITILHVPSEFQLGDLFTKPQPEALFLTQRESIMQWDAEHLSRADLLLLIPNHLRACDITGIDGDQNDRDQHDVRTQEQGIMTDKVIKTGSGNKGSKRSKQGHRGL